MMRLFRLALVGLLMAGLALVLAAVALAVAWNAQRLGLPDPLASWRPVLTLPGHHVPRDAAALGAPPGSAGRLVALAEDGRARVFDLATGVARLDIQDPRGPIHFASLAGQGAAVFTSSWDRTSGRGYARVATCPEGRPLLVLGTDHQAEDARTSPDGTRTATRVGDGAELWDSPSGEWLGRVVGAPVDFHPDGTRLLTLVEGGARLWPADGGASGAPGARLDPTTRVHSSGLAEGRFSPDGALVLLTSNHERIYLLESETGKELWSEKTWTGRFSPDSRLVLVQEQGALHLRTARHGKPFRTRKDTDIGHADFTPDGTQVLFKSYYGVRRWELEADRLLPRFGEVEGRFPQVSPDGATLLTRGPDHLSLFDGDTGRPLRRLEQGDGLDEAMFLAGGAAVMGHTHYGDRRTGRDRIRVWRPRDGQLLWQEEGERTLRTARPSRQGRLLTLSSPVRLVDSLTGRAVGRLREAIPLTWGNLSPDGSRLQARGPGERAPVRVFRVADGQELRDLAGAPAAPDPRHASADGTLVLTRRPEGPGEVLELLEAAGGAVRARMRSPAPVEAMALSPDGRRVALVRGGRLELWEAARGGLQDPPVLHGLPDPAHWVGFGPGGELVASDLHQVRVYQTLRARLTIWWQGLRALFGF